MLELKYWFGSITHLEEGTLSKVSKYCQTADLICAYLRTKIMIVPKLSYYGGNFLPKLFRSMRSVKRELDSSV